MLNVAVICMAINGPRFESQRLTLTALNGVFAVLLSPFGLVL
jgi:hypothetical protein